MFNTLAGTLKVEAEQAWNCLCEVNDNVCHVEYSTQSTQVAIVYKKDMGAAGKK